MNRPYYVQVSKVIIISLCAIVDQPTNVLAVFHECERRTFSKHFTKAIGSNLNSLSLQMSCFRGSGLASAHRSKLLNSRKSETLQIT